MKDQLTKKEKGFTVWTRCEPKVELPRIVCDWILLFGVQTLNKSNLKMQECRAADSEKTKVWVLK